jgi:hypothetical protein
MQESIKKLVKECAGLNIRLVNNLPLTLRFLVWSSPTSVRNPELSILWQPLHSRRKVFTRLVVYSIIIGISIVRGLYKFLKYKGFYYHHVKNKSSVLHIIPDVIVDDPDEVKTNYLIEDEGYPVDKLLFAYSRKRLKQGIRFSTLNYIIKIILFLKLFAALLNDFGRQLSNKKVTWKYLDALVLFASWILAQSWYFVWDFYHMINKYGISNCNRYLLVLHEMHFYSNIAWKIANERKLLGITAQHGLIIAEKLWYFPDESEIRANRPLPDIFLVYSDEIKKCLQHLYPKTKFFKCCSPRFRHWKSNCTLEHPVRESSHKEHTISKNHEYKNEKRVVIIANNAAIVHDIVVLKALRVLTRQNRKDYFILRLRPHPKERFGLLDRLWIQMAVILRKIEISSKSLREDFNEADLVIGANSTVIQEALLMKVPVMGVYNEDYIASSLVPSPFICQVDKLTEDELNQCMIKRQDDFLIQRLKTNIGIFNPDLTTKLIFDFCVN